ncbi:MAG: translation initiation factor IF-2 N-terminal domain-containing protein, partial [Acidobacteriaceae bacterium]
MSKVRINDLARELEVKSRAILDSLTQVGVTEKKTHSSSLEEDEAERVRQHFQRGGRNGSGAPKPESAEPRQKIDWSRVSKPGDVLKAIQQQKDEAAAVAAPRPPAPPAVRPPAPSGPVASAPPAAGPAQSLAASVPPAPSAAPRPPVPTPPANVGSSASSQPLSPQATSSQGPARAGAPTSMGTQGQFRPNPGGPGFGGQGQRPGTPP